MKSYVATEHTEGFRYAKTILMRRVQLYSASAASVGHRHAGA